MHVAANEPDIMELNAGACKVEARRPEAKGRRILPGDLAAEPDVIVNAHAQLKGELIRPIDDLCAAVHANHREKAYQEMKTRAQAYWKCRWSRTYLHSTCRGQCRSYRVYD